MTESQITGEYWLDGTTPLYADGNVGDWTHEGMVMDYVRREIADSLGMYEFTNDEYVDWDGFYRELMSRHDDDEDAMLKELQEEGVTDEQWAVANDMADAREYGMRVLGYHRVQAHSVETHAMTPSKLREIGNGLLEIAEQEGMPEGIENDPNWTFHVSVYSTGQSYNLTIGEMIRGTTQSINPQAASMDTYNKAANIAGRKHADAESLKTMHPYYAKKKFPFGD